MTEEDMVRLMEEDIQKLMSNPISVAMFEAERNLLDQPNVDRRAEYQRFMRKAILSHLSGVKGLDNCTPEQCVEAVKILRKYMHIFVDNVTDRIGCLDYLQDGYAIVDEVLSAYTPEGLKSNFYSIKNSGLGSSAVMYNPIVTAEHIEKAAELMDQFFEKFGEAMPYISQLWKQNKDLVKQMVYDKFGISRRNE